MAENGSRTPSAPMTMLDLQRLALSSVLLLAACVAPRAEHTGALQPVPAHAPAADHAEHAPQNDLPSITDAPRAGNRDLHGPADTQQYIDRLQAAERVRELKPDLVASKLKDLLLLATDAVIADVGCGPGVFVGPFAHTVPDGIVYAVDVEPAQLDVVRARITRDQLDNVVPVLASYTSPHLPPNRCDVVFIADTYHHIEDRTAYFADLRASLKPSGVLVILEYKEGDIPVGPPASHKVPVATRHAELAAAGYELRETLATHMWQDLEIWQRKRFYR